MAWLLAIFLSVCCQAHAEGPAIPEPEISEMLESESRLCGGYSYTQRIREINRRFNRWAAKRDSRGVMVSLGDSNTATAAYYPDYAGMSEAERKILAKTFHGAKDQRDGWWAAATPDPGKPERVTSWGGLTTRGLIEGYLWPGQPFPALAKILERFNPEFAVVMIGTNDVYRTPIIWPDVYEASVREVVASLVSKGAIPILVTLPPMLYSPGRLELLKEFDRRLERIACQEKLPIVRLVPLMNEMAGLKNDDPYKWKALAARYLQSDGIHLSELPVDKRRADRESLSSSGQLLHIWAVVNKLRFVWERLGRKLD